MYVERREKPRRTCSGAKLSAVSRTRTRPHVIRLYRQSPMCYYSLDTEGSSIINSGVFESKVASRILPEFAVCGVAFSGILVVSSSMRPILRPHSFQKET